VMTKARRYNRADLTTVGYLSSKAAYQGGGEWLNQCVDYIDGNHDFAQKFIKSNIPLIKRVIAVGGDQVALRNGAVYVNGQKLSEPYVYAADGGAQPTEPRGAVMLTMTISDLFR